MSETNPQTTDRKKAKALSAYWQATTRKEERRAYQRMLKLGFSDSYAAQDEMQTNIQR